ncbi:penicillin acylase family protein [Streptomyces johnsoniae]|uniref:Penicillin acylase family protein n=1 Tax=Streptomyces johnsoniae TaxID=3075532 RepID=A0ABU2RYI6_9ACTN|nr:penicillin acylase family protein [Streptomyces sp. DSM 41886]MDT0441807.1 penicillin acylase family protein [Streptomyces sp. DSM 41886]
MPAKKPRRRGRLIVIALVMLLVAGLGYGAYWSVSTVRASFPQVSGEIAIDGLSAPVTVTRDGNGIPQLYADSAQDLFRAQGYVHAQDRFWEMDVRRHMTAGRLSEMFGEDQVETDAFLRTLGWHDVAQQEYDELLSEETKAYLQAYADGVNAYLAENSGEEISVEYAALGFVNSYEPEEWDPVDSVAWLKAMAWDLRGNMQEEIDRSLLAERLSPEEIEQLYPDYPFDRNNPIVQENGGSDPDAGEPPGESLPGGGLPEGDGLPDDGLPAGAGDALGGASTQLAAIADSLDSVPALLGTNGSGIGSNSWVVHGDNTTTGMPLLANDPHLAPSLPGVWYQMGLHCSEVSAECPFDVSGFTFSGMPGVVIGHNQDISWGLTNLGADVTDLRLEKLSDGNYLRDGEQIPYETRNETIEVAGGDPREITVRSTGNGPIISDREEEYASVGDSAPVDSSAPDRGEGYAVSLSWTALEPSRTMDAVFSLNTASDWDEFRAAAQDFAVPSQNLIYADTAGNIGYQAPGLIPVRGQGDGRYPSPGWDSAYDWQDYIPQDELPWELNPDRGYIVTANQAVVGEDYDYALTDDWSYGTRSQRIEDLIRGTIEDGGKISMGDMQSIQLDNSNEMAKLLVPHLLRIDISDPYIREAQALLEGWDYTQDADSPAAAYYNAVWRNLLQLAFGNKLPKELRVEDQCLRVPPADESQPLENPGGGARLITECGERSPETAQPDGGDRWFEVVRGILEDPDNEWWQAPATTDQPEAGNRDELLARAMRDARWELTAELGKDIDTWSWGRLHRLMLNNQTLGTEGPGPVQWLLNRGPWNLAGGTDAVDASGWNAAGGYDITWVPSMRMVVSLDNFDESLWINLTGASGHAYHGNYTDQTTMWADGEYLPWAFSAEAVEERAEHTLTLTPPGSS